MMFSAEVNRLIRPVFLLSLLLTGAVACGPARRPVAGDEPAQPEEDLGTARVDGPPETCSDRLGPVAGTLLGSILTFPHAYFGIKIDHGSHAGQHAGVPPRRSLLLHLAPTPLSCAEDGDDVWNEGVAHFIHLEIREGDQQPEWCGLLSVAETVAPDWLLDFDCWIRSLRLVPGSRDPAALDVVQGCARLSFYRFRSRTGEENSEKEIIGEASGYFLARHCPALDREVSE